MFRHVSIIRSSSASCLFLAKITLIKIVTAWYSCNNLAMWQRVVLCRLRVARRAPDCMSVRCPPSDAEPTQYNMLPHRQIIIRISSSDYFTNVILARNRQLPDDDRMIETCRSIFKKSFNIKWSVCSSWYANWVTLRSARCKDKDVCILFEGKFSCLVKIFYVIITAISYVLGNSKTLFIFKKYEGESNANLKYIVFIIMDGMACWSMIHIQICVLFHSLLRGDFPSWWLQLLQCPMVSLLGVPDQAEESLLQN